jgi:hypothetical protein
MTTQLAGRKFESLTSASAPPDRARRQAAHVRLLSLTCSDKFALHPERDAANLLS